MFGTPQMELTIMGERAKRVHGAVPCPRCGNKGEAIVAPIDVGGGRATAMYVATNCPKDGVIEVLALNIEVPPGAVERPEEFQFDSEKRHVNWDAAVKA